MSEPSQRGPYLRRRRVRRERDPGLEQLDAARVERLVAAEREQVISAVRAGELDDLFSQAAKTGTIGKRKAA